MGFYQESYIEHGRTNKVCDNCGEIIEKGTPHYTIPYKFRSTVVLCEDCHDSLNEELGDDIEALFKKLFD